jgi:hypothetical protein
MRRFPRRGHNIEAHRTCTSADPSRSNNRDPRADLRGGFLVEEFEQVFSDVFLRDSEFYKKILEILCAGAKEMPAIKRLLTGNQHGRVEQSDRRAHRGIVNDCRALKRVPSIALTAINLRTIMYI